MKSVGLNIGRVREGLDDKSDSAQHTILPSVSPEYNLCDSLLLLLEEEEEEEEERERVVMALVWSPLVSCVLSVMTMGKLEEVEEEVEEVMDLWEGVQLQTLIFPSLWPVIKILSYTHSGPYYYNQLIHHSSFSFIFLFLLVFLFISFLSFSFSCTLDQTQQVMKSRGF